MEGREWLFLNQCWIKRAWLRGGKGEEKGKEEGKLPFSDDLTDVFKYVETVDKTGEVSG